MTTKSITNSFNQRCKSLRKQPMLYMKNQAVKLIFIYMFLFFTVFIYLNPAFGSLSNSKYIIIKNSHKIKFKQNFNLYSNFRLKYNLVICCVVRFHRSKIFLKIGLHYHDRVFSFYPEIAFKLQHRNSSLFIPKHLHFPQRFRNG